MCYGGVCGLNIKMDSAVPGSKMQPFGKVKKHKVAQTKTAEELREANKISKRKYRKEKAAKLNRFNEVQTIQLETADKHMTISFLLN